MSLGNVLSMPIIGLSGPAGSGKSEAASYLYNEWGMVEFTLAEPIKEAIGEILWMEVEDLFDHGVKEEPIEGLDISPRRLAQTLGTEWGRALDPDFWLKILSRRLASVYSFSYPPRGIVISDVRFNNEARWIRERKGKIVLLSGRQKPGVREHISEAGIDPFLLNFGIHNDQSLEYLYKELDRAVELCYPSLFSLGKVSDLQKGGDDY
jgi:hypothetical protein